MAYQINIYGSGVPANKVRDAFTTALAALAKDSPDEVAARPHGGFSVVEPNDDGLVTVEFIIDPAGHVLKDETVVPPKAEDAPDE